MKEKGEDCMFVGHIKEVIDVLKTDLARKTVFYGNNGVGKSFILNLLLQLTCMDRGDYESSNTC
jgi:putative ribosome biogenesis GTPase RsgA